MEEEEINIESALQVKRLFSSMKKEFLKHGFRANDEFFQNCLNNGPFINFVRVDTGEYTNLKKAFNLFKKNPSSETHNDAIKNMADRVVKLRDGMIRHNYLNKEKMTATELDW